MVTESSPDHGRRGRGRLPACRVARKGAPLRGPLFSFLDFKSYSDKSDCELVELTIPGAFEESAELGRSVYQKGAIRIF